MKRVFRMPDVCEYSGLSRSSIYRMIENGQFPRPIKIGTHAVGWLFEDVETWLATRKESAQ